jgi:hypothetical protein
MSSSRPSDPWRLPVVIAAAALTLGWGAALFAAPYLVRPDARASRGPRLLSSAVYLAGSLVCHQRTERSFRLAAVQMPVCARCLGIYVGAGAMALALVAVAGLNRAPVAQARAASGWRSAASNPRAVFIVGALPSLLTLVYEWTTGDTPANGIRAAAGVPLGAAVAAAIGSLR